MAICESIPKSLTYAQGSARGHRLFHALTNHKLLIASIAMVPISAFAYAYFFINHDTTVQQKKHKQHSVKAKGNKHGKEADRKVDNKEKLWKSPLGAVIVGASIGAALYILGKLITKLPTLFMALFGGALGSFAVIASIFVLFPGLLFILIGSFFFVF